MRIASAIVVGVIVGLLLSGAISSVLIPLLPPELRGAYIVWATTGVVVALTTWGFWAAASDRRD